MAHRTRRELDGRFTALLTRQVAMPQPQFILLIEVDDDSRVTHADYQHTFGFMVLPADTTGDGLTRATAADVIVTGIRVPGSRTPKCEEVCCRVMVL
jgi:hypothetical protein